MATTIDVAALSLHFVQGRLSAPKDAGGDTGATGKASTTICNSQRASEVRAAIRL